MKPWGTPAGDDGGEAPAGLGRALAGSEVAALFLDAGLRIRWFTPAAGHFLALARSDIDRPLNAIDLEVRDDSLNDDVAATLADQLPRNKEVSIEDDGWYLRQVLPWREAGREESAGVIVTYADITELKRGALAAQNSRRHLLLLADSLPVLIAYADAGLHYQFVNAGYREWFGVGPIQAYGQHMADVVGLATFKRMRPHCQTALSGQRVGYETRLPHRELGTREAHITHIPMVVENGEIAGFYTLISDITDTKRRENELLGRQEEYAQSQRIASMGELAATVAHQLNQPLGAITAYAAALQREPGGAEVRDIVAKIAEQAHAAGDIINELTEFIGRRTLDKETVDINEIVQRVLGLVEARVKATDAEVTQALDENVPQLSASPVQLEQALVNLTVNALEAVADTADRRLRLGTALEKDAVLISVADSGPGIPDEELTRIFETFHTTKQDGMGMGLAISRGIAESHGGRLWVETNAEGTVFYLRLPVTSAN